MKKITLAAITAATLSLSSFNALSNDLFGLSNDYQVQLGANYLDLDTQTYLRLSEFVLSSQNGFENSSALIPLHEEPLIIELMTTTQNGETPSQELLESVELLIDSRESYLAAILGVEKKDLNHIIGKFLDYQKLVNELNSLQKRDSFGTLSEKKKEEEEIEVIVVTAKKLRQLGGGSRLGIYLTSEARRAGFQQFTKFTVVFSGTNEKQQWRYWNTVPASPVGPKVPIDCTGGICTPSEDGF